MSQDQRVGPGIHPYAMATLAAEAQNNGYPPNIAQQAPQHGQQPNPNYYRPAQPRGSVSQGRPMPNPQFQRTAQTVNPGVSKMRYPGGSNAYVPGRQPIPSQHGPQPPMHTRPAVSSRIDSTNAAIAAIQAVIPAVVQPAPINRPAMALVGLPQPAGGDLKGTIRFEHEKGIQVVDEITAQKSAAEFSKFLGKTRKVRKPLWGLYWANRLDLNRKILLAENQCFKEAREEADELEDSEEEDHPRKGRPTVVPYIYNNTGSFDVEHPPPVALPDPEVALMRAQPNQMAQEHSQLVHHVPRATYPHQPVASMGPTQHYQLPPNDPIYAQGQLQRHYQGQSARQRAAQQVKTGRY